MEWVQRATSPWGEDILVRASWQPLWLVLTGAALFLLVHQILRRRWLGKPAKNVASEAGLPEHIDRHSLASRLFHWVMAGSMLVLLFTGFLPILGIQFNWVAIHWWAGLVLLGCIIFHVIHATVRWTFREVWISLRDLADWWSGMREAMGSESEASKPGKYPVDNKLYHYAIIVTSLGVVVTGLLMMVRIETPFFVRDPYMFSEGTWGLVFVVHGLSSIALVGLVIAHIYFAILPEKRFMMMSMVKGWIGRKDYVEYYDPERWDVPPESGSDEASSAGS